MSAPTSIAGPNAADQLSDVTGRGAQEEGTRRYTRSPEDVLRLVIFASLTLLLLGRTTWAAASIIGLERDLIEVLGVVSPTIERVLEGAIEIIGFVVLLGLLAIPLITKRYRLFGYIFGASVIASLSMRALEEFVTRDAASTVVNELAARAGI